MRDEVSGGWGWPLDEGGSWYHPGPDASSGRGCERVRVITFRSYYLRDSLEVGLRAEGGRTQKPAQAGGGTQQRGSVEGYSWINLRRPESDSLIPFGRRG